MAPISWLSVAHHHWIIGRAFVTLLLFFAYGTVIPCSSHPINHLLSLQPQQLLKLPTPPQQQPLQSQSQKPPFVDPVDGSSALFQQVQHSECDVSNGSGDRWQVIHVLRTSTIQECRQSCLTVSTLQQQALSCDQFEYRPQGDWCRLMTTQHHHGSRSQKQNDDLLFITFDATLHVTTNPPSSRRNKSQEVEEDPNHTHRWQEKGEEPVCQRRKSLVALQEKDTTTVPPTAQTQHVDGRGAARGTTIIGNAYNDGHQSELQRRRSLSYNDPLMQPQNNKFYHINNNNNNAPPSYNNLIDNNNFINNNNFISNNNVGDKHSQAMYEVPLSQLSNMMVNNDNGPGIGDDEDSNRGNNDNSLLGSLASLISKLSWQQQLHEQQHGYQQQQQQQQPLQEDNASIMNNNEGEESSPSSFSSDALSLIRYLLDLLLVKQQQQQHQQQSSPFDTTTTTAEVATLSTGGDSSAYPVDGSWKHYETKEGNNKEDGAPTFLEKAIRSQVSSFHIENIGRRNRKELPQTLTVDFNTFH